MSPYQLRFNKKILLAIITTLPIWVTNAQSITWANKLLEYSEKFQFENNFAELVLGPPTLYPSPNSLNEPHDPYSEGYIVHYQNTSRKNMVKVGFPKPLTANQIIVGGIFNIGTIEAIYVETKDGKEKLVYKLDKPASKPKFKSFATFIPSQTVYAVKLQINHSKINDWNIIKGIGLLNDPKLYQIAPNLIEDTTHKHTKVAIGETINSDDCYEFAPKISPDGKTIYFVKECENQEDQDIWYSELDSAGNWSEAKNIGVPLNNKGHNFVASISPDGNTLIIGNRYNPDGSDAGEGVSISTKDENGNWTMPKPLDIPGYKNTNDHANFYMSEGGDVLLMALQDEKSYGDLDLYVSLYNKTTKKWSEPKNLGPTINTSFSEDYPYLATDGKTLYFSSRGYTGYGGHDIYVTERLDDTWTTWTTPKNLGPFVNSKADDKGFVISRQGDHAYFNSADFYSDKHHMDIFKVDLPKILRQNPRILLSGVLKEKELGLPLRGFVSAKNSPMDVVAFCSSNPKTGKYVLSIPFGKVYILSAETFGHYAITENLALTDTSMAYEIQKDFTFRSLLDSGIVLKMENIFFDYAKAQLKEGSATDLQKLANIMKQQPNTLFEIAGHTDNIGSQAYNQKLSEERATAVKNYLVSQGIKKQYLKVVGYGKTNPIADNDTEEGRSQNRRVEVKILEKDVFIKDKGKSKPTADKK